MSPEEREPQHPEREPSPALMGQLMEMDPELLQVNLMHGPEDLEEFWVVSGMRVTGEQRPDGQALVEMDVRARLPYTPAGNEDARLLATSRVLRRAVQEHLEYLQRLLIGMQSDVYRNLNDALRRDLNASVEANRAALEKALRLADELPIQSVNAAE